MVILLFLFSNGVTSHAAFQRPALIMNLGEQRVLRIADLKRFSAGSDVVRATALPSNSRDQTNELMLKASRVGTTDLWIWTQDGESQIRTVHVLPHQSLSTGPNMDRLVRALSELQEAEVIQGEKQFLVEGLVRNANELKRISQIKKLFPEQVVVNVQADEKVVAHAVKAIQAWIENLKTAGLKSTPELEQHGPLLRLRGEATSLAQAQSWTKQVEAIYPLVETELRVMPDAHPTVYFRIYLLEIQKNRFESLGLSTRPSPESQGLQILRAFTQFQVLDVSSLDTSIHALASDGTARILSRPELVVRVPGQAELFAGGEYPIVNESRFFSKTDWKKHGLELKLNAIHDGGDRVRLEVTTQWSQLGNRPEGLKVPAIQSNRMQTHVDAYYGRPLLLCGLIEDRQRETLEGIPGLKDIPVLGRLFGSKDWRTDRSELVAVILPHRQIPKIEHRLATELGEFENYPKGPVPPPRDDGIRTPKAELELSPHFPWNVFELQKMATVSE